MSAGWAAVLFGSIVKVRKDLSFPIQSPDVIISHKMLFVPKNFKVGPLDKYTIIVYNKSIE